MENNNGSWAMERREKGSRRKLEVISLKRVGKANECGISPIDRKQEKGERKKVMGRRDKG